MTESVGMASALLKKLLGRTFCSFEIISPTLDTVKVDVNVIHNGLSMERMPFALYDTKSYDGTERNSDTQNADHFRKKDGNDKNDACKMGEFHK